MAVAKLHDRTRGAVTISAMLDRAATEISSFQRGSRQEIIQAIKNGKSTLGALEPVLDSIHKRRNEWLAHLDPRTVRDTAALALKAKLSIPDLDLALRETEKILLELSSLYEGVIGDLRFLGGDDYKSAM